MAYHDTIFKNPASATFNAAMTAMAPPKKGVIVVFSDKGLLDIINSTSAFLYPT